MTDGIQGSKHIIALSRDKVISVVCTPTQNWDQLFNILMGVQESFNESFNDSISFINEYLNDSINNPVNNSINNPINNSINNSFNNSLVLAMQPDVHVLRLPGTAISFVNRIVSQ